MSTVREYMQAQHTLEFTSVEIRAAINNMTDANKVMLADDQLMLI